MLEKLFGFDPAKHNIKTEVMAGITTFLTMAYILAVNPSIFSVLASKGMDTNAVFTSTALAAIIGTLMMAIYAKKPFGLAPGMGLNAFFVFTVCLTMGYSWQFALTAILIEGLIFVILTMTRIRTLIVDSIPASIKRAIGAGIGIYIAFIGLKNAGIIVESSATFVTIGDLPHGSALLGSIGIVLTSVLIARRVPGALLIGILATSLIGIPMGITKFQGIMDTPPSIAPVFCQFDFHNIFTVDMAIVVFTFLFIDMFDTAGGLIGIAYKGEMLDEEDKLPRANRALMADAVGTVVGACTGTSTVTSYIESATGVAAGARTGLASLVTGLLFLLAIFLSPVFLAIPTFTTAPALVLVGILMASAFKEIDFTEDIAASLGAFMAIAMMSFTYSIANGIMFGVLSFVIVRVFQGRAKDVAPIMWIAAVLFAIRIATLVI